MITVWIALALIGIVLLIRIGNRLNRIIEIAEQMPSPITVTINGKERYLVYPTISADAIAKHGVANKSEL